MVRTSSSSLITIQSAAAAEAKAKTRRDWLSSAAAAAGAATTAGPKGSTNSKQRPHPAVDPTTFVPPSALDHSNSPTQTQSQRKLPQPHSDPLGQRLNPIFLVPSPPSSSPKMGPFLSLLLLVLFMAFSTLLFGLLPLSLRLSKLTLRILEVGGAGLLLGAACSIVMPEGAATLFRAGATADEHAHGESPEGLLAVSFLTGVLLMFVIDQIMAPGAHSHQEFSDPSSECERCEDSTGPAEVASAAFLGDQHQRQHQHHHHHGHEDSHGGYDHSTGQHAGSSFGRASFRRLSRPESLLMTRSRSYIRQGGSSRGAAKIPSSWRVKSGLRAGDEEGKDTATTEAGDMTRESLDQEADETAEMIPDESQVDGEGRLREQVPRKAMRSNAIPPHLLPDERFSSKSPLLKNARSPPASPPRESGALDDPSLSQPLRSNGQHHNGPRRYPSASALSLSSSHSVSSRRSARHGPSGPSLRAAFTSIFGLFIHAACDGIALGASSSSSDESLKLLVLGAIMIHKAPAAFGLCTLLLSQRLSRRDIKKAMALFAFATPIGAIGTYLLLNIFLVGGGGFSQGQGQGHEDATTSTGPQVSPNQVGSALSFSAGSFIYVAMDAVHELASHSSDIDEVSHDESAANAATAAAEEDIDGEGGQGRQRQRSTKHILGRTGRIAVLILGAVLPRALQKVVGHGH